MFNFEQINQQIDNIKNISLILDDTPTYTADFYLWTNKSAIFFLLIVVALVIATLISVYSDRILIKILGWVTVVCLLAGLIVSEVNVAKLKHESSFKHKNDQFELLHEGKYKFDTKVDMIHKSYHDMFGEKYVTLPEIRDHLKIEFLHADEFKKLSNTEQEEIINAIDELK